MRLGDVCTKIGSGATPKGGKEAYKPSGIPLIRSQNVLDWLFTSNGLAFVDEGQAAALANVEVEPRDILLNITGDSVARACTVPDWCTPARVNQHVSIVRPGPDLDPTFLLCFLQSSKPLLLKLASSGATRNALTKGMIGDLEIELPNIETQRAIASLIGQIQQKIVLNQQTNDYLAELLDVLFVDMLNDADASWERLSLLDIASYKNGLAMQKFRPAPGDPGLPVLKIKELGQGVCTPDSERCASTIDESVKIHDGNLVFSWSGTLLLDFWAGGDAGLNQHLFKVTSDRYPSWLYYLWTKHHMDRFIMLAKDRATTMGHIKRSALAESEVLIPPVEQLEVLTRRMQPIVDELVVNKIQSRNLAGLRDVLLPKLMSGEIDVSNVRLSMPPNNHFGDCSLESSFQKPKER